MYNWYVYNHHVSHEIERKSALSRKLLLVWIFENNEIIFEVQNWKV